MWQRLTGSVSLPCVCAYGFVWQRLEDGPSPRYCTLRERETCYTPPRGFASPQGGRGNEPAAHTAECERQEERSEWKDRMNEWRGLVSAGIEHASLAGSGRRCYLCADPRPNGLRGGGEAAPSRSSFRPEPAPPAQPWGRSAVNRTGWRNSISKVTGNRCWRFFTSVADSEVERLSSFETVRFTACLGLLFMVLFSHRFNVTALSSGPTKDTFNRWCFVSKFLRLNKSDLLLLLLQNVWMQKRIKRRPPFYSNLLKVLKTDFFILFTSVLGQINVTQQLLEWLWGQLHTATGKLCLFLYCKVCLEITVGLKCGCEDICVSLVVVSTAAVYNSLSSP